jgi:glycosyltransferase involved in cell wall biosynthesis
VAEAAGRVALDDVRVLVVATEQVGARMAGPAIRARAIARELAARGAQVTLAMPEVPGEHDPALDGIELAAYGTPSARSIGALARRADVVCTQPLRVDIEWALARSGARIVHDLYVPSFLERIAQLSVEPGDERLRTRLLERDRREYAAAIALGDAFVCASERQRDLWLGALGQAGRLDLHLLERDPRAEQLVGVVPFGVDDPPQPVRPAAGTGPIRGALVPEDSIVALWTGGLWNWFDPVLVVEALAAARAGDPRLRLVVLGMRHPDAAWQEQDASRRVRERAEELGLVAAGAVVFVEGWVPYAERGAWLADADVAVSAHHDTLETRFSFRTRFLDHLWAGLPTISTRGGDLTDELAAQGAAIVVDESDRDAWTAALLHVARDDAARADLARAASDLARGYRWSDVLGPLAAIVAQQAAERAAGAPDRRSRRRLHDLVSYLALLVRVRIQAKGIGSLAGAVRGAAGR